MFEPLKQTGVKMGNMSYCRFENTSKDLYDCVENWDLDEEEASDYEIKGRAEIIRLAREIVDMEGLED